MKKFILTFILVIVAVAAQAATYRVKYDVQNERSTNFTVVVNSNRLTIGNNSYDLRRMGTITNSGITFDSYAYGLTGNGMFCVSTNSITVEKGLWNKLTGYIIIIDQKAYLADKVQ